MREQKGSNVLGWLLLFRCKISTFSTVLHLFDRLINRSLWNLCRCEMQPCVNYLVAP